MSYLTEETEKVEKLGPAFGKVAGNLEKDSPVFLSKLLENSRRKLLSVFGKVLINLERKWPSFSVAVTGKLEKVGSVVGKSLGHASYDPLDLALSSPSQLHVSHQDTRARLTCANTGNL